MTDRKTENGGYQAALRILDGIRAHGINQSLANMRAVVEGLGNPQDSFVSAQVAGTNGKSSTARMLASLLHEEGFHVGLYTSPELVEYPERFEIDGRVISRGLFAQIVHDAWKAQGQASIPSGERLTEFELLTVAALILFKRERVDFAVLEVGMGGTWDATSVVDPAVAVICGVGLEHTALLGNTLEKIAEVKAGVIKPACSVVLGPGTEPVRDVFLNRTRQCDTFARIVAEDTGGEVAGTNPQATVSYKLREDAGTLHLEVCGNHGTYRFSLQAPSYQAANAACAIAAAESALGRALDPASCCRAFGSVVLPGRFETLRETPLLIIDAAHNPQGAHSLATAIDERFGPDSKPQLLLAVLKDKDADGIIRALLPYVSHLSVTETASPRALAAEQLALRVKAISGRSPAVFKTPREALEGLQDTPDSQALVAAGSITLAGEIKRLFS